MAGYNPNIAVAGDEPGITAGNSKVLYEELYIMVIK